MMADELHTCQTALEEGYATLSLSNQVKEDSLSMMEQEKKQHEAFDEEKSRLELNRTHDFIEMGRLKDHANEQGKQLEELRHFMVEK